LVRAAVRRLPRPSFGARSPTLPRPVPHRLRCQEPSPRRREGSHGGPPLLAAAAAASSPCDTAEAWARQCDCLGGVQQPSSRSPCSLRWLNVASVPLESLDCSRWAGLRRCGVSPGSPVAPPCGGGRNKERNGSRERSGNAHGVQKQRVHQDPRRAGEQVGPVSLPDQPRPGVQRPRLRAEAEAEAPRQHGCRLRPRPLASIFFILPFLIFFRNDLGKTYFQHLTPFNRISPVDVTHNIVTLCALT
jgi:hypothetical protein